MLSMMVQVAKVCRMVRLKYSLNNQKPPSLICEKVMLPAPTASTISSGGVPECWKRGSSIPTAVSAATVEEPVQMRMSAATHHPAINGEIEVPERICAI